MEFFSKKERRGGGAGSVCRQALRFWRRRADASVPLSCALISEGGRRDDDTDDTDPASDGGAGDLREVSAALATSESGVERAEPDDGGEKASSREEEWSGALQRHAIWGSTRWLLVRRGEFLRRRVQFDAWPDALHSSVTATWVL